MSKLNRLIKVYVAENETTMQQVAKDLCLSDDALLRRRKGEVELTFAEAVKLAAYLGVTLEHLAEAIL